MRTTIVALAFGLSSVSALPAGPARRDSGNTPSPDADLCALNGSCTTDSAAVNSASSVVPSASISETAASASVIIPCPASTGKPNFPSTNDGSGSLSIFDGFKRWVGLSNRDADATSTFAEASDASCGTAVSSVPTDETTVAATVTSSGPASTSLALAPSASPVLNTSGHLGVFSGFKRRAQLSNQDVGTDESPQPRAVKSISRAFTKPESIPGWNRDVHESIEQRDVDDLDAVSAVDSEAVTLEPTSTPTFADYASSVTASALPLDNRVEKLSVDIPGWIHGLQGDFERRGSDDTQPTSNNPSKRALDMGSVDIPAWPRNAQPTLEQRDVDNALSDSDSATSAGLTSAPTSIDHPSSAPKLEWEPLVGSAIAGWDPLGFRRDVQEAVERALARSLRGRQVGSVGGDIHNVERRMSRIRRYD